MFDQVVEGQFRYFPVGGDHGTCSQFHFMIGCSAAFPSLAVGSYLLQAIRRNVGHERLSSRVTAPRLKVLFRYPVDFQDWFLIRHLMDHPFRMS